MGEQRFRAEHHIRRGADFRRAYGRRCRASDGMVLIYGCPNDLPYPRLGISASRKLGNAVRRNRWKRLLREAFRLSRVRLPEGIDLVVVPRQGVEPELAKLLDSIERLARRLGNKLGKPRE